MKQIRLFHNFIKNSLRFWESIPLFLYTKKLNLFRYCSFYTKSKSKITVPKLIWSCWKFSKICLKLLIHDLVRKCGSSTCNIDFCDPRPTWHFFLCHSLKLLKNPYILEWVFWGTTEVKDQGQSLPWRYGFWRIAFHCLFFKSGSGLGLWLLYWIM